MEVDRPGPGEELNTGDVKPARQAATAIVMRDGSDGPEVLLVQRNPESRFMGGAWVFPGGAVIRPLGDVIVLMPPLGIEPAELHQLVEIVGASIEAAAGSAAGETRLAA